jgi:glucokinase
LNPRGRAASGLAVGIDVGGTKIAAGLVDGRSGRILAREEVPTRPERGGEDVLRECAALARSVGGGDAPVGIGLCELVDLDGRPVSAETVDWRDLDIQGAFGAPCVAIESDVRAAALAEARYGDARSPFLHAVVGTGASLCLVVDGRPYAGARGRAIVLGAPPVERIASGAALARGAGLDEAASALGRVLAVLVNALDPFVLVIGGGLGDEPAFRARVAAVVQSSLAYPPVPPLEIVGSRLGRDGGLVGAALVALEANVGRP